MPTPEMSQDNLLKAIEKNDLPTVVEIFFSHGKAKLDNNEINAGCYYLTNAYIYALEAGSGRIEELHDLLKFYNREE